MCLCACMKNATQLSLLQKAPPCSQITYKQKIKYLTIHGKILVLYTLSISLTPAFQKVSLQGVGEGLMFYVMLQSVHTLATKNN